MSALARRRAVAGIVVAAAIAANATLVGLAGAQTGPSVPPPTPVPPDGRPSPFPTVLHTPRDGVPTPVIHARSAMLADLDGGTVLFRKGATTPRPIASLTKVMTALLALERTALDETVRVSNSAVFDPSDFGASSTLGLRTGERITVRNLLYGLLLGSANDAAEALAIHIGGSTDRFVSMMNRRARALGMHDTSFASPHGLDDAGRSTAEDLLVLLRAAHEEPTFSSIVATRFHVIPGPPGAGRPRRIQNRNALLWLYDGAVGTKTGLTAGAGPCLAAVAVRDDRRLVAIVLGAEREAFSPAAALLNHGFDGYREETLVASGEALGTIELDGREVPVSAARELETLLPVAAGDRIERTVRVDDDAAFPPPPGERVAMLVVRAPGIRLGAVPLVAGLPPSASPPAGSWWTRGIGALADAAGDALAALIG